MLLSPESIGMYLFVFLPVFAFIFVFFRYVAFIRYWMPSPDNIGPYGSVIKSSRQLFPHLPLIKHFSDKGKIFPCRHPISSCTVYCAANMIGYIRISSLGINTLPEAKRANVVIISYYYYYYYYYYSLIFVEDIFRGVRPSTALGVLTTQ